MCLPVYNWVKDFFEVLCLFVCLIWGSYFIPVGCLACMPKQRLAQRSLFDHFQAPSTPILTCNLVTGNLINQTCYYYNQSPHNAVSTTEVSTYADFSLCTRQWGNSTVVLRNAFFLRNKNARNVGNRCIRGLQYRSVYICRNSTSLGCYKTRYVTKQDVSVCDYTIYSQMV